MSKKKVSGTLPSKKTLKAYKRVRPVLSPLLDLFSVVDDVMDEAGAFDPDRIHKSLGRVYRGWLDTREALDPEFDRAKYRHEMKGRKKKATTPLGRELRAWGSQTSSTDPSQTSEKNASPKGKSGKKSAKSSVPPVKSEGHASSGHSKKENRSESGEGSRKGNAKGSSNGSKKRATQRSPKSKD